MIDSSSTSVFAIRSSRSALENDAYVDSFSNTIEREHVTTTIWFATTDISTWCTVFSIPCMLKSENFSAPQS